MEKTNDILRDQWANLGVAFVAKSKIKNVDPELTLLASLKYFHDDRKLLKLTVSWLGDFGDLVHTERLKALGKNLSAQEYAWLGLLADHMVQTIGDIRFKSIRDIAKKHLGKTPPLFEQSKLHQLHYERELSLGSNPAGSNFGLQIADSDLIGIPYRVIVSAKTAGKVEVKRRDSSEARMLEVEELMNELKK